MLFDLQGRRRRVVQGTYLMLALLMGGGLVFFGIGGDVSGGLFDAFSDQRGGGGGSLIEDRIERSEKRVQQNPRDEAALKDLARSHYQLVADEADPNTGAFPPNARDALRKSAAAWERYLALDPKRPDDSLARLMVQVYGELGLRQPAKAARAAEVVANADPSAAAFLQLTQYAAQAGQSRKADLAGRRAVELAPRDQRKAVKQQVAQLKAAAAGAPPGGPGAAGAAAGAPPAQGGAPQP